MLDVQPPNTNVVKVGSSEFVPGWVRLELELIFILKSKSLPLVHSTLAEDLVEGTCTLTPLLASHKPALTYIPASVHRHTEMREQNIIYIYLYNIIHKKTVIRNITIIFLFFYNHSHFIITFKSYELEKWIHIWGIVFKRTHNVLIATWRI